MPPIARSRADDVDDDRRLPREPEVVAIADRPRPASRADAATLDTTRGAWEDAPGIPGFFTTVDHKRIGIRYIYTAFVFFFIAGLLALVMRVQLATPNSNVLTPRDVQRAVHDARHDDDLPVQHAGARRLRQLSHPAADRQRATWRSRG